MVFRNQALAEKMATKSLHAGVGESFAACLSVSLVYVIMVIMVPLNSCLGV